MNKNKTILIADRNPHIRGYLIRELVDEGYRVFSVKTFVQLREWIVNQHPLNLLVLDPNLPEVSSRQCLEDLLDHLHSVPVILHCLSVDCPLFLLDRLQSEFIEKDGDSVTALKRKIHRLIDGEHCAHLNRTPSTQTNSQADFEENGSGSSRISGFVNRK